MVDAYGPETTLCPDVPVLAISLQAGFTVLGTKFDQNLVGYVSKETPRVTASNG